MPNALEIEDGNPWYLSPNVWTVPGDDPTGSLGSPIEGVSCYIWAKVRNNGTDGVQNATVRYYWANPAVGFDRTTANLVGTAFVSLAPGQTSDVLCLTPWIPAFLNEGHECILAEAFHQPLDPLPGVPDFNVPTDRHVAQRNLSVVRTTRAVEGSFRFVFEVHNASRKPRSFVLTAEVADLAQLEGLIPLLGPNFTLPSEEGRVRGLQRCA